MTILAIFLVKWSWILLLAFLGARKAKAVRAAQSQKRTVRFYAVVEEPWLREVRKQW